MSWGSRLASSICMLLVAGGCASTTVQRMAKEATVPGGPPRNACEEETWLVMSVSRAEIYEASGPSKAQRGYALYRPGSNEPVDLPALLDELGSDDILERKRDEVADYDAKHSLATWLRIGGGAAAVVGTVVFISGFETVQTGSGEQTHVEAGTVAAGSILFGLGIGSGAIAYFVDPPLPERSKANATRYVFSDPPDSLREIETLVRRNNQKARERCRVKGVSAAAQRLVGASATVSEGDPLEQF